MRKFCCFSVLVLAIGVGFNVEGRSQPPGGDPPPMPQPGTVIPPFVREKLTFTEAQEKQIAALEQDVRNRLNKMLSQKQMQQLEEAFRQGPGQGGPGGQGGQGAGKGPGGQGGPPNGGQGGPGAGKGGPPGQGGPGGGQKGPQGKGPGGPGQGGPGQGGPGQGGPGQGGPGQGGPGGGQGGPGMGEPGLVLPPFVREKVQFSPTQQQQLTQLEQYARASLTKIFTNDQNRQFQEALRQGPGMPPGGGQGGPGGGQQGKPGQPKNNQ